MMTRCPNPSIRTSFLKSIAEEISNWLHNFLVYQFNWLYNLPQERRLASLENYQPPQTQLPSLKESRHDQCTTSLQRSRRPSPDRGPQHAHPPLSCISG